jgi:hypothetical protein
VRNRSAWIAGALGAAGMAYRAVRRRTNDQDHETVPDPRAGELRRKLDEVKPLADERAEFESGETSVDEADPATVEGKRAAVHARGQAAVRDMKGPTTKE